MTNPVTDIYELHWNNHTKILKGTFDVFRNHNELVDVTLSCEGMKLKAHKIVLSACSEYFLDLFRDNPCTHPIIILTNIKYEAMLNVLNFMYMGEINIGMEQLDSFLETAEILQVKGLTVEISEQTDLPRNVHEKYSEVENVKRGVEDNDCQNNLYHTHPKIKKVSQNLSDNDTFIDYDKLKTVSDGREDEADTSDLTICVDQMKTEMVNLDILTDDLIEYDDGTTKTYPCHKCDKVFNHYISLKLHLPRHSGDTSCSLCHAVLGRRYDLKVHMRRKHNVQLA